MHLHNWQEIIYSFIWYNSDKGLRYEALNIIKVCRSLSGVSLGCTGEFEVFKAGSWIILGLHCDSQTCYRQKPAAKAFWKTFKGKNMLVTHIRSTLNPHQSIQECLECVLVQGRIQGFKKEDRRTRTETGPTGAKFHRACGRHDLRVIYTKI